MLEIKAFNISLKLLYYIKTIFTLSKFERSLFLKGFFISTLFFLIYKIVPFRYYYPKLIENPSYFLSDEEKLKTIRILLKTIKRIEKFSIWKSNCLNKVFTLKLLCNRTGIKSNVILSISNILQLEKSAHAILLIDNSINYLANNKSPMHSIYLK